MYIKLYRMCAEDKVICLIPPFIVANDLCFIWVSCLDNVNIDCSGFLLLGFCKHYQYIHSLFSCPLDSSSRPSRIFFQALYG